MTQDSNLGAATPAVIPAFNMEAFLTHGAERKRICAARDIPTGSFSSDLVFDGQSSVPYLESDRPAPLNVYGRSKHAAEEAIEATGPAELVRVFGRLSASTEAGRAASRADGMASE